MRFWNENPELYDEICINAIADWVIKNSNSRDADHEKLVEFISEELFHDCPSSGYDIFLALQNVAWKQTVEREKDFWADKTDEAYEKGKEQGLIKCNE